MQCAEFNAIECNKLNKSPDNGFCALVSEKMSGSVGLLVIFFFLCFKCNSMNMSGIGCDIMYESDVKIRMAVFY